MIKLHSLTGILHRDIAAKVTVEEKEQALRQVSVLKQWMHENVLRKGDFTVLFAPQGRPGANYRDVVPEKPR